MEYTLDRVERDIKAAAKYYQTYLADMPEKELYARAQYDFKHEDGVSPYIPAKSANKVDTVSYQIVSDIPSIEICDVMNPRASAETDKALILLYLNNVLERSAMFAKVPPIREFALNIPTYGVKVGRVVMAPELLEKGENPVIIQSLNPRCGYPWGKDCFIVRYSRTAKELDETIERWNDETEEDYKLIDWKMGEKDSDSTVYDWIEVEYPEYRGIFLGREGILTPIYRKELVDNPYGMVTYVHRYSGWAATDSQNRPEHLARGINDYLHRPYQALASMYTALLYGISTNMFGRDVLTKTVAEERQVMSDGTQVVPDGTQQGVGQQAMWEQKPRELNAATISVLSMLNQDIDEGSIYDNMGGDKIPGVGSGVFNSQLLGQGKLKIRVAGNQIELGLKELLEKAIILAYKFGPFTINGRDKISSKNIHLPVNVRVNLEPQDAERDQSRIDNGIKVFAAGLAPWRIVYEKYLKLDNVSGARREMIIDSVVRSQRFLDLVGEAAASEWGMAELAGSMEQKSAANLMIESVAQPQLPKTNIINNIQQPPSQGLRPDMYQPQQLRGPNMPYSRQIPQDQTGLLNQSDTAQRYGGRTGEMSDRGA